MDPQSITPPPGAEDHAGFWAAVLAGAAGIIAGIGKLVSSIGGAKAAPPEDPREAREKRDATRQAILRIEDKINAMSVASAEDHARAAAQRDEMKHMLEDQRAWLLELSTRTGALENQMAAVKAVDEDRKDRRK